MTANNNQVAKLPEAHRFGWQRAWPLWILAGFFGVIFTANGVLLYLANTSWTGLTTEQAYEEGRTYNKELARSDAQHKLGWRASLKATPQQAEGRHLVRLDLAMTQAEGKPLTGGQVDLLMVRPTHEGFDLKVSMTEGPAGTYGAHVELPLPGQWEVRALVTTATGEFRLTERITVE
jgi:nitrogen fixation protein FixH